MKKLTILTLVSALIVLFYSCDNETESTTSNGQIKFSFSEVESASNNSLSTNRSTEELTLTSILIGIEDEEGNIEEKTLTLNSFNDEYITSPISLTTGNYEITEFIVYSEDSSVYATPVEGSYLSKFVEDPITISFTVSSDSVTKVCPEVIATKGYSVDDFGYATFTFTIVDTTIDLNNGLVAYYPFNGNANDESGNGYDAQDVNATLTTDRNGNENSAYSFNGTDEYIDMGKQLVSGFPFSISYWAKKFASIGTNEHSIYYGDNYYYGILSRINLSKCGYEATFGAGKDLENTYLLNNSIDTLSTEWHHIIVIFNDNLDTDLYVDNTKTELLDTIYNHQDSRPSEFKTNFTIGTFQLMRHDGSINDNGIYSSYHKGELDDIRVYNRALTEEEVKVLYNE